jgi:type I restriction enzyme, R subunit
MTAQRHEPEAVTRSARIDPLLTACGWAIVPFVEGPPLPVPAPHAVTEYPTTNGPADYALTVGGQILGVVEAKKLTIGPAGVLTQAERYSRGVENGSFNFRGYRAPFLYSTNGEVLYFHDVRDPLNTSRRVKQFHTPGALQELLGRDLRTACDWLTANPNDHRWLRPYQREANVAVEDAIAKRKRTMLLAMATGCGKTFTMVNQVYRLMKSGEAKRVLFLVDRRALAAQAVKAFASFEPEPNLKFDSIYEVYSQRFRREDLDEDEKYDPKVLPREYLTDPQPKHAYVYVSTIQRMAINLFGRAAVWSGEGDDIEDDAEQLDIPIHAFDVIVADECHRGYTTAEQSVWRNTLDHFDAIKIGLTATPAAHTKAYFTDIVYRYEYSRAVREGFLVDYDVVKLRSDVRLDGMFLREGETVDYIDPDSGSEQRDQLEDERAFETTDVERKVTSPDSNRKILEEIKKYADEHEARYGRFPKTLIFAANDLPHVSHADQLVELARLVFGRGESFVQKITGSPTVDRPLHRIREFRNRPNPGIVVSVDLMSTGVDIPDLEYIVFLRPVKSRILFEQMLGRGTRKGDRHKDKSHFVVFDCFDGTLLQYFRNSTAITSDPPEQPNRTLEEVVESIWSNRDRDYNVRCLVKRLQRIDKEMSGEARGQIAAEFGIPDGNLAKFAAALPNVLRNEFTSTMKLLRNKEFQKRLLTSKAKRTFISAPEHEDTVSSEYLFRDTAGREYKPGDYLEEFAKFVRENPERIDAIQILLNRPKGWSTAALKELRAKLSTTPLRFTPDNLEKAHRVRYNKALVDIISMVKHAAKESEPLLTAAERVDRAFEKLIAGRTFTPIQQAWLDRIRAHLVVSLTIERTDFDIIPILSDAGGWGGANRVFEGKLQDLIADLNQAIAA